MSVAVKYDQSADDPREWTYSATCDDHGDLHIHADEGTAFLAARVPREFHPQHVAERKAAEWLTADLPAMRRQVRAEYPDLTPAEVAVEAIRRLDAK